MFRLSLVVACLIRALFCAAQIPYWVQHVGGAGTDHVADVKVDAQGNTYVIGEFTSEILLDTIPIASHGASDILVAKFNPAGAALWVVTAGGYGIDRGMTLGLGTDGSLVISGQFMDEADLFGQPFTSAGGTLDLFVASLDSAGGTLNWVRTVSGADGPEKPGMVTASANGHVTVVGEFHGAADFSGTVLNSEIDPETLAPSTDAFIATYSAAGDLLWVKQGAGKFTDRAVAVLSGSNDDLYVAGQFSDTLQLGVAHPNAMYNAIFLVRLDASGNEVWFRKCGGALLNQVRDMAWSGANELMLAGDLRGTTHFFDAQPDAISASDTYSYFLARITADGEFVTAATVGSQDPLTLRGVAVRGDSVATLGEFKCQFSYLSDHYGSGLFMATGAQDLFVTKHRLSDLGFTGAQQFGGHGAKRAGRIALTPDQAPVFCGGYAELLVFPEDGSFWEGTQTVHTPQNDTVPYCGDSLYWRYGAIYAASGRDGFVARAFAPGRPPYDVWRRDPDGGCALDPLNACIYTYTTPRCADTVIVCYPPPLGMSPQFVIMDLAAAWSLNGFNDPDQIGFDVTFAWNTGATGSFIAPETEGWYTCTMTASNGCWSWTDSIYVVITPPPQPLISDATGANVDANVYQTQSIFICDTTAWIWDPIAGVTDSVQWYANGILVENDSVLADTTGVYTLVISNELGCVNVNTVIVIQTPSPDLPNVTGADLQLMYQGEPLNGDTVYGCEPGGCVGGYLLDTWYVDGVPAQLPSDVVIAYLTEPQCAGMSFATPGDTLYWLASYSQGGWLHFTFTAVLDDLPCGSTTYIFTVSDSVFVVMLSSPTVYPPMGDLLCDTDTLQMTLGGCFGCDSVVWSGPGVVTVTDDGMSAWLDAIGTYYITAYTIHDEVICPSVTQITYLEAPIIPPLLASVPDGVICQGDSVLLWTTLPGYDFQWIGPGGALNVDNDSVWVHDAGDYQLMMVGWGCPVTSIPFAVEFFGTPYIQFDDLGNVFCPGGSVQVAVVADGPTTITWLPPLSGSDPVQVISTPGTYTCVLSMCGAVQQYPFTVIMGTPDAELLTPGPYVICDGDPVVLQALPGEESYQWEPAGAADPQYTVSDPGAYWFTVVDEYGCSDTSATVNVTSYDIAVPLSATDTALCAGGSVDMEVEGSGTITWYTDEQLSNVAHTGGSWTIDPVVNTVTYYVQQADGPCTGNVVPLIITALPAPGAPAITAPEVGCEGDALSLSCNAPAGSAVTWTSVSGTFVGNPWVISPASLADAGTYTCFVTIGDCVGPLSSVVVEVVNCDIDVPNVITPNGDGHNDGLSLESPTGAPLKLTLVDRWGIHVKEMEGAHIYWNGMADGGDLIPDGVYYYVLSYLRADGDRVERTGYIQVIH